jgi:plastocyanin
MKKLFHFGMVLALLIGMAAYALPVSASTPQSYTVIVGSEDVGRGVSLMAYFPHTVKIHVGDSITWVVNSHEIHTVTFLAGQTLESFVIPAPQGMASPLQINPVAAFPTPTNGSYDGSSYMNSGIMSTDPGFDKTFTLTFTQQGVFDYVCYVHGQVMSGEVDVVGADVSVPTPAEVQAQGQAELKAAWRQVPAVLAQARTQALPPVRNSDGTFTDTITLGYMSGQIMVMQFFPSRMTVHPGDTIVWKLSSMNGDAPHTVTFYNGAPDLPFVTVVPTQNGPVVLINPEVFYPSQAVMNEEPLNNTDFFNSGLLVPGVHETFSIKIGNISGELYYECILHDSSGMTASLFVAPH